MKRAGDYYNFNHMKKKPVNKYKNHFNEQVVIELVFYNFFYMKKAGGY